MITMKLRLLPGLECDMEAARTAVEAASAEQPPPGDVAAADKAGQLGEDTRVQGQPGLLIAG